MRALVQRVLGASVTVAGEAVSSIGPGLLILLGVREGDTEAEAAFLADKCANLRIFEDADGKMNLSALEIGGELLVVSQFTLYGDCRKGRRPSFVQAARPEMSEPLYKRFVQLCGETGLSVKTGEFGANMKVELINDGPVTILAEKEAS
ncbi:MAG: D-tyrosyl-tRNA(Tyr) deacylase [Lentisphaeria bacterium]|nr:D-tyrosyl-tRNA(Tyr) deacylase [Lentisphaeria bacterium]